MASSELSPLSAPFKIALLLLTGVSTHYSLTPPQKAASKTILENKTLFERGVLWITWCSKTLVWMATLSDALATYLSAYHPSTAPSFVCPRASDFSEYAMGLSPAPSPSPLQSPSPMLIAGALIATFANLLRQRCFRALGPLFTFEVTIQPDHALITTGPYRVVRHPSYLGVYLTLLGPTLVASAPGSWIRECWFSFACTSRTTSSSSIWAAATLGTEAGPAFGSSLALPTVGQAVIFLLIAFWLVKFAFVFKSTQRRLRVEDHELHKVFGAEWEEYAQNVPCRLLPGIW